MFQSGDSDPYLHHVRYADVPPCNNVAAGRVVVWLQTRERNYVRGLKREAALLKRGVVDALHLFYFAEMLDFSLSYTCLRRTR